MDIDNFIDFFDVNKFTLIYCVIILLVPYWFRNKFSKSELSNLTLTLGITGTFIGIFLGLLEFDTTNIETSVVDLLDGLKIAFLTSITGLITSIVVKISPGIWGVIVRVDDNNIEAELISTLKELSNNTISFQKSINDLSQSIAGDSETSLSTQILKLRDQNQSGFEKMNKSFEDFAEKVVADNTQSLIDALTDVMKDFNSKINEQFGENFKELNSAVKDMLTWQKAYKDQINELVSTYSTISESIKDIDITLENSASNHKKIILSNEKLIDMVKDFSSMVDSFGELGEKASESLPIIEERMDLIVSKTANHIDESLDSISLNYEKFSEKQQEIVESYNRNISEMIEQNKERIQLLDKELGNELEKSLESLGSSLSTLSSKFVEDYGPITQRLKGLLDDLNK
tara:strand:+ start:436 stop:1641 length:1206 start_codon:yes stop_codon:yes gene_type:complete